MESHERLIQIAEEIARKLPEVARNEWMRWVRLAESQGLDKALNLAQRLSKDFTLRSNIKRANELIAQAISTNLPTLKRMNPADCRTTLTYVGRILTINTARGSLRD